MNNIAPSTRISGLWSPEPYQPDSTEDLLLLGLSCQGSNVYALLRRGQLYEEGGYVPQN